MKPAISPSESRSDSLFSTAKKGRAHDAGPRAVVVFLCALCALAGPGCVHLGDPLPPPVPLPPGVPNVAVILDGLSDNETGMRTFRAAGTIIVKIPEIESTQISRESTLIYRAPGDLNVVGRRYGTRGIELTYVDDAFLIEFPTRREYCLKEDVESFETVSSADIVREMFHPENWTHLSDREVRMTGYDEASQTAELEIWALERPAWRRRVITVQGAPWVLLENRLFDREGHLVAHTARKNYHEQAGLRYPTEIESQFPGEEAWMRFIMRRVDINLDVDAAVFDIAGRVTRLNQAGFTRVDIFAGEGPAVEDLTGN